VNKIKHLEMIQTIINRMAGNSFLIKGWCVTLVAAILALAAKDSDKRLIAVAYYPVLMFWILDAYFLYHERRFRNLYNGVRTVDESTIDFSMDASPFAASETFWSAFFSTTLLLFYVVMICAILVSVLIVFNLI
jgi:hypothetical protein